MDSFDTIPPCCHALSKSRFFVTRLHGTDTVLQLTLLSRNLHLCTTVAQTYFSTLHSGHKSNIFPALIVNVTHAPDLCDKSVSCLDGTRESCGELLNVGWIRVSKKLQESVSSSVPTEQTMKDGAACKISDIFILFSGSRVVLPKPIC